MDAAEANSKAMKIGAGVGLVAGLLSLALGGASTCIPFCGCFAGPMNWALPAGTGLIGGAAAAATADWSGVGADERTGFGVGLGLRGGGVGAALAVLAYIVVALVSPIFGIVLNVLIYGGGDMETLIGALMASLITTAIGLVVNLGIAFVSLLIGVGLGAAGGAIVGVTKGD